MAVERRDPLPVGRYGVFVKEDEDEAWHSWTAENAGKVRVVSTIPSLALGGDGLPVFYTTPTGEIIQKIVGSNVLFEVSSPVKWVGFGFPDIESRPPEAWVEEHTEDPGKYLGDPYAEIKSLVLLGGAIYLGGILLASFTSRRPR